MLMKKEDVIIDKMNRQIIFDNDGKPILDPSMLIKGFDTQAYQKQKIITSNQQ